MRVNKFKCKQNASFDYPSLAGHTSFFREFRRLKCHVPCIEVQVLREHTDQVLHVSFSHNGKMFATCSKDGTIKVSFPLRNPALDLSPRF